MAKTDLPRNLPEAGYPRYVVAGRIEHTSKQGGHYGFPRHLVSPPALLLNYVDYDAAPGDKCPVGIFLGMRVRLRRKFGFTRLFAVTTHGPAARITCESRVPHSFG